MTGTVIFDPLVPWPVLAVVAGIVAFAVCIAVWRGLSGWALRGLAGLVLLGALSGPAFQQEDRAPLTDIVVLLEDQSASQALSDRRAQTAEASVALARAVAARDNTELRRVASQNGTSLNHTAIAALQTGLGLAPPARRRRDLSALAGKWTVEQADEFEMNTQGFGQIDEEIWK
mgnify:CR=1 FL=1